MKWPHRAEEQDELDVEPGDILQILAEDDSGWWQGQNQRTGAAGIFPAVLLDPAVPAGQLATGGTDDYI